MVLSARVALEGSGKFGGLWLEDVLGGGGMGGPPGRSCWARCSLLDALYVVDVAAVDVIGDPRVVVGIS